ncbi:MAG: hypothetical protein DCC55_31275 [Chloroflexi bacterium]|nr:MAG: hypothetical protein DCC55_31275 [Chloroflexota bacterium]
MTYNKEFIECMVETSTAQLCVRTREGVGTPIVLISGGPGMPDYLQPVARLLGRYKTVTYDQRGTGASKATNGRYDVDAHIADLEAIRRHLGVEQIHLFGHSWGGLLAQLYATAHPQQVASLFLCSPSTGAGRDWVAMEQAVMQYNRRQSTAWQFALLGLWSLLAQLPGQVGQRALQRMYNQVWQNYQRTATPVPADPRILSGVGPAATFQTRASIVKLPAGMLASVLPAASIPLYITFGEHDIYGLFIEDVRKRYPQATIEIHGNCGHLPWLDCPELFQEKLTDFYGQVMAGVTTRHQER